MQAAEFLLFRVAQVQLGKQAPDPDRKTCEQRALDVAEPAHAAREEDSGHPVGEQEVNVFLKKKATKNISFHRVVKKGS